MARVIALLVAVAALGRAARRGVGRDVHHRADRPRARTARGAHRRARRGRRRRARDVARRRADQRRRARRQRDGRAGAFAVDLTLTGLDRSVFGVRAILQGDDVNEDVERELLLQLGLLRPRPHRPRAARLAGARGVHGRPAVAGRRVFLEVDGRPCDTHREDPGRRGDGHGLQLRPASHAEDRAGRGAARRLGGQRRHGVHAGGHRRSHRRGGGAAARHDRPRHRRALARHVPAGHRGTVGKDSGSFAFGPFRALRAGGQLLVRYDRAGRVKFVATAPVTAARTPPRRA